MAKAFFKLPDNPTAFRVSDRTAADLAAYQKETNQQVGLGSDQTDFSQIKEISNLDDLYKDPDFVTPKSAVISSDNLRNAENKKALDESKALLEKDKQIATLERDAKISTLKKQIGGDQALSIPTTEPSKSNFTEDFTKLRESSGLTGLETEINALKTKLLENADATRYGIEDIEKGGGVRDIASRQMGQVATEGNREQDALTRKLSTLTDLYNSKVGTINTLMNFKQLDYQNAVAEYDKKYGRAIQAQQLVMNYESKLDSEENVQRDDARANLTVIQGMIKDSGKSWDSVDLQTKINIQKEELRAGIPIGTFANFAKALPKANLLATKDGVDEQGNSIVSFVYADDNGNPGIVRTVKTGITGTRDADIVKSLIIQNADAGILPTDSVAVAEAKIKKSPSYLKSLRSGSGSPTELDTKLEQNAFIYDAMDKKVGDDGYISPETWRDLRRGYPLSKSDFDATFRGFINPSHPFHYEGFEEYKIKFKK